MLSLCTRAGAEDPSQASLPGVGPCLGTWLQGHKARLAGLKHEVPCWSWEESCLHVSVSGKAITGVCPSGKAHLAQSDGAGSQADEAPLPAVRVLGQGKLLGQGLDHMLDLNGVVLGHELPHQPGERGERWGLWDRWNQATCCGGLWAGTRKGDDLFRKRKWESACSGHVLSVLLQAACAGQVWAVSLLWVSISLCVQRNKE